MFSCLMTNDSNTSKDPSVSNSLSGLSGCQILIHKHNGEFFITKKSASISYNKRLVKQCEKQSQFKSDLENISAVPVSDSAYGEDGLFSFKMKYINHLNFYMFLNTCSADDFKIMANDLVSFLDKNLKEAQEKLVPKTVFINKFESVQKSLSQNSQFKEQFDFFSNYLKSLPDLIKIPMGYCHGDFTFDNMLFSRRRMQILLIDFLDSFIDSPLIDIVKLRQDVRYKWYLHKNNIKNENLDAEKVLISLSYIDKVLSDFLDQKKVDHDSIMLFEYFNFLRILPYSDSIKTQNYLISILEKISQQMKG